LYQEQGIFRTYKSNFYIPQFMKSVYGSLSSYRYQCCQVARMWSDVIIP